MNALANTIRIALLIVLLVTPWLFGGVWASVQWILMLIVAILLALDLVTRFSDANRPNLIPTAWLPLLAGIALGVFQLIPWTPSLAEWFAAESRQWRQEFTTSATAASGEAQATEPMSASTPRTLYAVATRENLALLSLATAVFVLASLHLVDKQSILWLCTGAAVCGAALSFFGLVQRLSWNGKFYWVFEPLYGGFQSFGPFVNRNNAGGFLNLCLAAGLGLLVWVHWNQIESRDESGRRSSRGSRQRRRSGSVRQDPQPEPAPEKAADRPAGAVASENVSMPATEEQPTVEAAGWTVGDARSPSEAEVKPRTESPTEPKPEAAAESQLSAAYERSRRQSSSAEKSGKESKIRSRRHAHRGSGKGSRARGIYPSSYGPTSADFSVNSVRETVSEYFGDLNATRLWSVALVAFIAGGVLCTASRGSILAMFAATMVTITALAIRGGNRKYAFGLLVVMVAGVGLMSWAGQTDFVKSRFELLFEDSQYETGRLPNWIEALKTVPEFWVAGTGLGSYRFVYERFQHRYLRDIAHFHAENQFVQALVEGGVIALVLLIAAIALSMVAITKLYRSGGPANTALAVAGTFGLASQLVGGCFDFGLYLPSNALLLAAICGAVIGRAALLSVWPTTVLDSDTKPSSAYSVPPLREGHSAGDSMLPDSQAVVAGDTRSRRAYRSRGSRRSKSTASSSLIALHAPTPLVTVIVGTLLLGCLFGSLELNKAAKIEAVVRDFPLDVIVEMESPDEVSAAISPLLLALPQRWDDALAHRQLATLWMQLYRAETYQRLLAEQRATAEQDAGELPAEEASARQRDKTTERDQELWRRSSVWHLHATIHDLVRQGDAVSVNKLLQQTSVKDRLLPALRHVTIAREAAPTIPQLHYMLAELAAAKEPDGDDQIHLDRARTLAPGDATLLYWTGLLDLNNGRQDRACQSWNRSLTLSATHLDDIMESARGKLTIRDLLEKVLPARSDILLAVIQRNFLSPDKSKLRNVFLERAEEVLRSTDLPPAQMAYVTGSIYRLQGRQTDAARLLEEAIHRDGSQLRWRYEYARLLVELKEFDKALEQATFLRTERPKVGSYRRLHEDINRKRHRAGAPERDEN